MAYPKYKEEKKVHGDLLDLLKKHFFEDEMEIKDEEFDEMKPMSKKMGMKRGKQYDADDSDIDFEGEEDMYDSEGVDDDYYDKMMDESEDEEEDEESELSKDKRKKMAIVLVTKKAGRGKSKKM